MKNSRTILLITGLLAAGLAYNTTFAQEQTAIRKEQAKAFAKVKHGKESHKHKVKNEVKPHVKAQALHIKRDRKHQAKHMKREMKVHPKARVKHDVKRQVDRSLKPLSMERLKPKRLNR